MSASAIETITNNLVDGYNQLVSGTFQEASQVQNQRRTDLDLEDRWVDRWVYTANLPLFRIREGNLEYGLSGRHAFDAIAGENIGEFTGQILQNGVYRLTELQVKKLDGLASDIVWAKAEDLGLKRENNEFGYFLIDTFDVAAEKLNAAQKLFAVKVHGSMETKYNPAQELPDYGENMKNMIMLQGSGCTRLWLPTSEHIANYLQRGGVIARAFVLGGLVYLSNSSANFRSVVDHGALRGVRLKVAEGDARKNYDAAYDLVVAQPQMLTPQQREGLANVVADLSRQKQ